MNNDEIMVSVFCTVYNHEKYLRQCLDGFVMQKTNFAFEVIIHDDASTDHSADIIREYTQNYPNIFRPIYQEKNQYSQGISFAKEYMLPLARGKYHASCEGDDYWCDENKLQMQVDAMEAHPECHLCVHRVRFVTEADELADKTSPDFPLESGVLLSNYFMQLVGKYHCPFQTSSYLRRMDDMKEFLANPPEFRRVCDVGDVPGLLYCGSLGDVYYIDREMSHYRMQSIGSWTERQGKSLEKRKQHWHSMVRTYEEFDKYTEYRYSELVAKCIKRSQIEWYKCMTSEKEYAKLLLKRENREYLKDENAKYVMFVFLRAYAPFLADFYYWLKGKKRNE